MLEKEGEEDAEEGRGKDADLLHSSLDVEGFGHAALVLNGCLHVIVQRSNHTVQIRVPSDLQQDVKKPIPANQVKCLGSVNEGNVEGFLLFPVVLLELARG